MEKVQQMEGVHSSESKVEDTGGFPPTYLVGLSLPRSILIAP